jgi:hypothetical protein
MAGRKRKVSSHKGEKSFVLGTLCFDVCDCGRRQSATAQTKILRTLVALILDSSIG